MPDIAKAYVQIIPSAEGIKGKLEETLGGEAESAGKAAGGKFSKIFGGVAKAGLAALGATAEGAGGQTPVNPSTTVSPGPVVKNQLLPFCTPFDNGPVWAPALSGGIRIPRDPESPF